MKKVIDRASSRGYFNHGWLKTHHTFSFANYYNPERIHFGALRVLNDDSVDPSMGFDTHPHKNMEVISIPKPEYNNFDIRPLLKPNELALILSPNGKTPASIKQDAWFSMGSFDTEKTIEYKMHQEGNGVYIFVLEGEITVAEERLSKRDGIGVWDTKEFPIHILKGTQLLLIEVPM